MISSRRISLKRGFTVIEVMIASAILVIGFAAVIALLAQSNSVHRHSLDISQASMLADEIFEDVSLAYVTRWRDLNPVNGIPDFMEKAGLGGLSADYPQREGFEYRVRFNHRRDRETNDGRRRRPTRSLDQNELLVEVVINWNEPSGPKSMSAHRVVLIRHHQE